MTSYDETAGTEDPKSLLGQLRASFDAKSHDETLSVEETLDEMWAERILAGRELSGSAVVAAAADLVIPPQSVRPEARKRMIDAASRALAERRKLNGLLPVLLRTAREASGLTLDTVAAESHLDMNLVASLERGDIRVDLRMDVDTVAAWIHAVPVDRELVVRSLRRSLGVGWTGDSLLAAGVADAPSNADTYVECVLRRLAVIEEQP
ncbi:MAG TPA: helix-turn-helix domain-containing protein [Acidothermaceae bacterium]|jgi:transcriptional regulator with XRE-family HTH domain